MTQRSFRGEHRLGPSLCSCNGGAEADGGGSAKPGESAMAHAGATQSRTGAGMGSVTGLNPENPTQSYQEMQNAERVGNFLGAAAPAFMGAVAPGASAAIGLARSVASGKGPGEILAGYAGGLINGAINKATGGAYGAMQQAGAVSKSLGGPSVPNVGGMIAGAMGGRSAGRSVERPDSAPATVAQRSDRADSPEQIQVPDQVAASATGGRQPDANVNYNLFAGMTHGGWARRKVKQGAAA